MNALVRCRLPPTAQGYTSGAGGVVTLLSPSLPEQLKQSHQNESHPGAWRGAGLAPGALKPAPNRGSSVWS